MNARCSGPKCGSAGSVFLLALIGGLAFLSIEGCSLPLARAEREARLEISSGGLTTLTVKTDNGAIRVHGVDDPAAVVTVVARIRAQGTSQSGVVQALADVELIAPTSDNGHTLQLDWQWREGASHSEHISIDYDVRLPASIALELESQNGALSAEGSSTAAALITHNGEINVRGGGQRLIATTHNGEIDIKTPAEQVQLTSHNGEVTARLTREGPVSGTIETYNGEVAVAFGDKTAAALRCESQNGRVRNRIRELSGEEGKSTFTGSLREGSQQQLSIQTHNGDITLE